MTRLVIELAIATQTSPADWWDEDLRSIRTAVHVINTQSNTDAEGRLMSG